jgi:hypothetical protein
MNRVLLVAGVISFVLAGSVLGVWYAQGATRITQYQVATVEVEQDEFGDEIETTVMKDEFQFGLLPDKGYDGAGPLAGGFSALGIALLAFLGIRRRKEVKDEQA